MELKVLYTALPQGMDSDGLKRGLDEVLEDSGWLTGSGPGWVELELEGERQNPKYGILAVKHYLQRAALPPDTQIELAGTAVGIYE